MAKPDTGLTIVPQPGMTISFGNGSTKQNSGDLSIFDAMKMFKMSKEDVKAFDTDGLEGLSAIELIALSQKAQQQTAPADATATEQGGFGGILKGVLSFVLGRIFGGR